MKNVTALMLLTLVASFASAGNNENRAAVRFDGDLCFVNFYIAEYDDVFVLQGDTFRIRSQYASGSATGLTPNGHSNASLRCSGHHDLDLSKAQAGKGGFCTLEGIPSDDVFGVVSPGGTWNFYCNFPRYNPKKAD